MVGGNILGSPTTVAGTRDQRSFLFIAHEVRMMEVRSKVLQAGVGLYRLPATLTNREISRSLVFAEFANYEGLAQGVDCALWRGYLRFSLRPSLSDGEK